jgi:hypothetical protein
MRKNSALAFLLVLTIVLSTACSANQSSNVTTAVQATTTPATTVETTAFETTPATTKSPYKYIYHYPLIDYIATGQDPYEAFTAAVVKATALENQPFAKEGFRSGTLTTIRIDAVLKSDGTIQEGQQYKLYEEYTTVPDPADPNTIHVNLGGFLLPLNLNEQYLLLLGKDAVLDFCDYFIAGDTETRGKFPLTAATIAAEFRNLTAGEMEFPTGPNPTFNGEEMPLSGLWAMAGTLFDKYIKNSVLVDHIAICRFATSAIYDVTDAGQLSLLYDALNSETTVAGTASSGDPDYTMIDYFGSQEETIKLWLGADRCSFERSSQPGQFYMASSTGSETLRNLINQVVIPFENALYAQEQYCSTPVLDLVLKFPPADLSIVKPPAQCRGSLTTSSLDSLAAIMQSTGSRIELMLPDGANLHFAAATFETINQFSFSFADELTGNDLHYFATHTNIDFEPSGKEWKKIAFKGLTLYRRTLAHAEPDYTFTQCYWEKDGWRLILEVTGDVSDTDLSRFLSLRPVTYNATANPAESGQLIFSSQAVIDQLVAAHPDIVFDQQKNYFYELFNTQSLSSLTRFMQTNLRKGFYYYDCTVANIPLIGYGLQNDGTFVTTRAGSQRDDQILTFDYRTDQDYSVNRAYPPTPSDQLLGDIRDFGSLTVAGIEYTFLVKKNDDRYITRISWVENGARFNISKRWTTWEWVTPELIEELVAPVKYVG